MTPGPHNPFGTPPSGRGQIRQPVREVGMDDPAGMRPAKMIDKIMGSSQVDEMGRLLANPEMFKDAPPYVIEMMNKVRMLHIEVAAIKLALIRRGLLTLEEISEAMQVINGEVENIFREMIGQVERAVNQSPTQPPPRRPDQQP